MRKVKTCENSTNRRLRLSRFLPLLTAVLLLSAPIAGFAQNPQPTSLSFTPNQGYAGNHCYTMTVGNGANMRVWLRYNIDGVSQPDYDINLDAQGKWTNACLPYNIKDGTYYHTAIRNNLNTEWVTLSPSVTYKVHPPQPKWATIATTPPTNPLVVTAGQGSYTITVGNGAGASGTPVTLDTKYTLNGTNMQIAGWPGLSPVSETSPDGKLEMQVGPCTAVGNYVFTKLKNTQNSEIIPPEVDVWVTLPSPPTIVVYPPSGPTVTLVSPASGLRGATVSVSLTGTNLCGMNLTAPGMSFSNITVGTNGTSATASFNLSSASVGTTIVTLTAAGGSTTFNFTVTAPPPTVTCLTPADGAQGRNVTVMITGTNLYNLTNASLSTGHAGLSFTDVTSTNVNGTCASATFNISASAATGTPVITLNTSGGSTIFSLFAITPPPPPPTSPRKEYIFSGGRRIAIEIP